MKVKVLEQVSKMWTNQDALDWRVVEIADGKAEK